MVKMNEGIPISSDEEAAHSNHLSEKLATRSEKYIDKTDNKILLLVYDLQNVVTLSKRS